MIEFRPLHVDLHVSSIYDNDDRSLHMQSFECSGWEFSLYSIKLIAVYRLSYSIAHLVLPGNFLKNSQTVWSILRYNYCIKEFWQRSKSATKMSYITQPI